VTMNKNTAPVTKTVTPARMVQPIHFEDFDGKQFERLVFAYHARTDRWLSLEWFGQTGKDKGRDIVGVREVDGQKDGESICVLCANWQKLTLAKVKTDLNNALKSMQQRPVKVRVVSGHSIPAKLRDDAKEYVTTIGIRNCELWSGAEFEEFIRTHAESLLFRFLQGEAFPDTANDLLLFAWGSIPIDDDERLALISLAFDRPAFSTPIYQESSLPAFKKALEDTIQVLGTGIWQTREGTVIRRLPMIADIIDSSKRDALKITLKKIVSLRSLFDSLLREGLITHCHCNDADCPVYTMPQEVAQELTTARDQVLLAFRQACPSFTPSAG
jgi:hypothetical protein